MSKQKNKGFLAFLWSITSSDDGYVPKKKEKKERVPLTIRQWIRRVLAIFIIVLTFLLLICVYILMNPEQAVFVNRFFRIEYVMIELIIEYTIYTIFVTIFIFFALIFAFMFFRFLVLKTRSIWKRIFVLLLVLFSCSLMLGALSSWYYAYLQFQKFSLDYLSGQVRVYNNDHLLDLTAKGNLTSESIKQARVYQGSYGNLIGPIKVRYDLSGFINRLRIVEGLKDTVQPIEYQISTKNTDDYDRNGGTEIASSVLEPSSPFLIHTIDEPGEYQWSGIVSGVNVAGEAIEIPIPFPVITVNHLVEYDSVRSITGGVSYTFDATSLRDLGNVHWYIESEQQVDEDGERVPTPQASDFTFTPDQKFLSRDRICLTIQELAEGLEQPCAWNFFVRDFEDENILGQLIHKEDPLDRFRYRFSFEDLHTRAGDIDSIQWFVNQGLGDVNYTTGNTQGTDEIFDVTFDSGGIKTVTAHVRDTVGNLRHFVQKVSLDEYVPLKSGFGLQMVDEEGENIFGDESIYEKNHYIVDDIMAPVEITLDATRIRPANERIRYVGAKWDFDNDGEFEEVGRKMTYDIPHSGRHELRVRYLFEDVDFDNNVVELYTDEKLSFISDESELFVRFSLNPESIYAPSRVRIDATPSKALYEDIVKFIYDFGDGNSQEGEGEIDYIYRESGEYDITVTAVTESGNRVDKTKRLILKVPQSIARLRSSIPSGRILAGQEVIFSSDLSQGDIERVSWNFGDNSSEVEGSEVRHIYDRPGEYSVKLSIEYISGIIEEDEQVFVVVEE